MSHACGRRLHRICVPAPVLQRRCPARPHLCGVVTRYPDPDGSCNFQGAGMKNCRPVARLQILSGYKESRPARDQRILSEVYGGKMVRCGCRAAVYHSKVACMGKRISCEQQHVKRKQKILSGFTESRAAICVDRTKAASDWQAAGGKSLDLIVSRSRVDCPSEQYPGTDKIAPQQHR